MTLSEFITDLNYALRGIDDDAPTSGEEYDYWIAILNRKTRELYENVNNNWEVIHKTVMPNEPGTVATSATTTLTGTNTFFTDYNAGDTIVVDGETVRTIDTITSNTVLTVTVAFDNTVTANTFTRATIIQAGDSTYSLHRSLINPSGQDQGDVYVAKTDGRNTYYDLIKPEEATDVLRRVHISGQHPQVLTFTNTIASGDAIVGGTLIVPGYYMPDDVSETTDLIPLPNPDWAVMAVASEIAFNDITYEDKAPDLNAKANALYRQMVSKSRKGTRGNPQQTPSKVYKIRSY